MALVWYDPELAKQLIAGFPLGSESCTCYSGEMATDRNTFGKTILPGKKIRLATGDTSGGTTVQQVDDAIVSLGTDDMLSTGYYAEFDRLDHALQEGKGFLAAIRYRGVHKYQRKLIAQLGFIPQEALIWGSELFGSDDQDWHAVLFHRWLAPGQVVVIHGKTLAGPAKERGLIVYDPLCDGRRSTVAKGPVVYPESLVRSILADSLIGGRMYGALTLNCTHEQAAPPPKEPVRTLQWGGKPIKRRPLRTKKPANLRERPRRNKQDPTRYVIRHLPTGSRFYAWQVTNEGTMLAGSRRWFGNKGGDAWVHESRFQ